MRILLGIDGNETGGLLAALNRLVPIGGQELIVVYVHDTGVRGELDVMREGVFRRAIPGPRRARIGKAEQARADAILRDAETASGDYGAQVTTVAEAGEPGRVLVTIAADRGADLVAVGARTGEQPVRAGPKSLGHTARFVIDHSPSPVLLLRRSPVKS